MEITKEDVLKHTSLSPIEAKTVIEYLEDRSNKRYSSIYAWKDLDPNVQELFSFNGGDEDWLVIVRKGAFMYPPRWLEAISVDNNPDVYDLGDVLVYVGSHA